MNSKTNLLKTEMTLFNNKIEIEIEAKENKCVHDKSFIKESVKELINNAELVYTEENYVQFSDKFGSELTNIGDQRQLSDKEDVMDKITCIKDDPYLLGEDELPFKGLNYQFGNVSDLNTEENYEFRSNNIVLDHFNTYVSTSDPYKSSLSSESDMLQHIVGTNDGLQYNCSQCDFTTSVRSIAKAHGSKHEGKKHQCPHCDKEFSHHPSLLNHIRSQHPSAGDSVCQLCGYSFINEKGVKHHQRQRHRGHDYDAPLEGPQCLQCNITFASYAAYTLHLSVSIKHDEDKENNLNSRRRRNRATKQPITCEHCDIKCETARAYHKHFTSEHPDKPRTRYLFLVPTMCEICGRIFHNSTYLKEHLVVHKTGVKPYKCDVCFKTFALKLHLQMHKKTHDKNRPLHPCQVCEKLFANKQNLSKHLLIHTGEKPFECEVCYKCFPTKDRMKCHYQYVHEKKPWPKRNRNRSKNVCESTVLSGDELATCY